MFFCILARTAYHHWWNNEFWIIPANYKEKLQDICLRTESQENVGHAARQQPQKHKSFYQRMVKEEQSECFGKAESNPDLNPIKMSWKDRSKQFIGEKPPTSNEFFSYCSKGGHTRYWQQRFTYFWNAHICNTVFFLSINKWQRKYLSKKIYMFVSGLFVYFLDLWKSDDVLVHNYAEI